MRLITLNEYKYYIIEKSYCKFDNYYKRKENRKKLLKEKYDDKFLLKIIEDTYSFANKIINILDEQDSIEIKQEREPINTFIDLDLSNNAKSDRIIIDENNNHYSI